MYIGFAKDTGIMLFSDILILNHFMQRFSNVQELYQILHTGDIYRRCLEIFLEQIFQTHDVSLLQKGMRDFQKEKDFGGLYGDFSDFS